MSRWASIDERFWNKVNKKGPIPDDKSLGRCWIWTGLKNERGYGRIYFDGKTTKAHRVSVFLKSGKMHKNHTLHRCHNPSCVNDSHLYEGTHSENMRDMALSGRANNGQSEKKTCPRGHKYDRKNTVSRPDNPSHRGCRTCRVNATRNWRNRLAVAARARIALQEPLCPI